MNSIKNSVPIATILKPFIFSREKSEQFFYEVKTINITEINAKLNFDLSLIFDINLINDFQYEQYCLILLKVHAN